MGVASKDMSELTVIYYTSNRERGDFEKRIRDALLTTIGDLPLISVSQKPIDFGENICVGDVGVSDQNAHRQFQVGAKAAKTKFVCAAEADFLYPREYFEFVPPREDRAYRADNLYLLWEKSNFKKKQHSEGATVVGREYVIDMIDKELDGLDEWRRELEPPRKGPRTFKESGFETFHNKTPIVTFKTFQGMHRKSSYTNELSEDKLPHWGAPEELRSKYL